jgi:hypothetical protein
MGGIFWRIIVAVVCVFLAFQLIPPLADIFGLTLSASAMKVITICVGAIAFFYVVGGSWPPAWWRRG